MSSSLLRGALAGVALACIGNIVHADDAATVESRQATMKQQSKDMAAVKAYLDDKADLASAQTAGADLVIQVAKIPDIFPKGTGMDALPGKSYARPVIWTEADKFTGLAKTAADKAVALDAALKGGDKAAIAAAFGDMGKTGCGGWHEPFREKKPS
ncbi:MAG: cytochrome c [Alphaproteobacteria bacterium]|nr:cytochrome c [Alphaproteobacteria bacterium]